MADQKRQMSPGAEGKKGARSNVSCSQPKTKSSDPLITGGSLLFCLKKPINHVFLLTCSRNLRREMLF